jgi:oligopeptide/dipeptide ABC transporter ATP-binding protein
MESRPVPEVNGAKDDRQSPLLEVRDLVIEYDTPVPGGRKQSQMLRAVRGVSFNVRAGSIFGLVGESGCGKSSIARAIVQLQPATSGEIRFKGNDIFSNSRSARHKLNKAIQIVFQDSMAALSPRRRVSQTLREPLDHFRIGDPAERTAKVGCLLEKVGLDTNVGEAFPHQLSGGQRQRVAIARALAPEPELIIADEPASSLDVSVQSRIIRQISRLRKEIGVSFLLISHDLAVVNQLADDVGVLYLGTMAELGPAAEVLTRPAHPYTEALLRAVPKSIPGQHMGLTGLPGEPPSPLTPPPGCVFHTRCARVMERCRDSIPQMQVIRNVQTKDVENLTIDHGVRCFLHRE